MLVACSFLYAFIRSFGGFGTVKGRVAACERVEVVLFAV
jgi:hypothetical protein